MSEEGLKKENEELKKENKELKRKLMEWEREAYTFDGYDTNWELERLKEEIEGREEDAWAAGFSDGFDAGKRRTEKKARRCQCAFIQAKQS